MYPIPRGHKRPCPPYLAEKKRAQEQLWTSDEKIISSIVDAMELFFMSGHLNGKGTFAFLIMFEVFVDSYRMK